MMNFRAVNKAIIALLGTSAAARFTVTGYEAQGVAASEVRGKKRNVQSFFTQGVFPKGSGRAYGATDHYMTFTLGFTVSAAATCNLSIINSDPPANAAAITAALAAMQDAAAVAGDSMDELFDLVYQILMDARNIDLGLPIGTVTDRWVGTIKKDSPMPMGTLLVLTGEAHYTCRTCEAITGDAGAVMTGGVDASIEMPGDEIQQTGVTGGARSSGYTDDVQHDDGSEIL